MELIEYLDATFNYRKLRRSRKKRNLSIAEVAKKTGIPAATLQKYESGIIKKIPLETLKKYVLYMEQIISFTMDGLRFLCLVAFLEWF